MVGLASLGLGIDLAFCEGRYKASEQELLALSEQGPKVSEDNLVFALLPPWVREANGVVFGFRGVGWKHGKGVFIPPDPRPMERNAFLRATFVMLIKHFFIVDLLVAFIQLIPGLGSPAGGTIFFANLPRAPRYLVSTSIAVIAACGMVSAFHTLYAAATLIGVGVFGQSPTSWPPIMHNPWGSHSISDLWAKRWHQMFRRTFLVFGGIPGGWIAGRPGVVLGCFIASGLLHECGIYILGRGLDHRVTFFFGIQGVFVLLEVLWRRITGYKVQGWAGRIWTYAVVLSTGQSCCESLPCALLSRTSRLMTITVDAWMQRGLGASVFIPYWLSPAQAVIIPSVCQLLHV